MKYFSIYLYDKINYSQSCLKIKKKTSQTWLLSKILTILIYYEYISSIKKITCSKSEV